MRALIVDDHPLARRGLAVILRDSLGITDIMEADAGAGALSVARVEKPDIILLDMHMPGSQPSRELCTQLRASAPTAAIVLVTAFDHVSEIRDCLAEGARGCLLKDTVEQDFAASIRSVISGNLVIDPRIAEKIALQTVASSPGGVQLTARERDVLGLLAEGKSNRLIATDLAISETTVKGYVSELISKFNASSRLEVVVLANRAGLL
jgi:DNA-binding NarL/FixJ family response regulator